jgi:hypothetical protein
MLYRNVVTAPASKYLNDVILSSAKNLVFSLCYEILQGARPEPKDEILRRAQNDKAKGSG